MVVVPYLSVASAFAGSFALDLADQLEILNTWLIITFFNKKFRNNLPPRPGPIKPGGIGGTPLGGMPPGIGGGIPVGTGATPRPACIALPMPGIPAAAPIPGTLAIPTS